MELCYLHFHLPSDPEATCRAFQNWLLSGPLPARSLLLATSDYHQSSSLAHTLGLTQPSALPRLEEVIFKQVSSLWPEMDNRGRIQATVYAIQVPATTSRELLAEVGETGGKDHKGKSVFSGSTSARKHCRIGPRCVFLSHVPLNFTCSVGQRAENPVFFLPPSI